MTNPNPNQCGTQIKDLHVMIGRCPLDRQYGDPSGILQMLVVLISGKQTTTKATTQLKKWTTQDNKNVHLSYFKTILNKESIEKE